MNLPDTCNDNSNEYERLNMTPQDILKTEIYKELTHRHGEIIGGQKLMHILGFSTTSALYQAMKRNTLGLSVFYVEGRRGKFALTIDIAEWLISHREKTKTQIFKEIPTQFQSKIKKI